MPTIQRYPTTAKKPTMDIRKLREQHGLLQWEAADKLGFCRSYLALVENGKQGISIAMMNALIRVFGVKYEDFYKT